MGKSANEAVLIEYIQHHRVQKVVKSFGTWEERKESSVDIVNDLRREDDRQSLRSNHGNRVRPVLGVYGYRQAPFLTLA